MEYKFDPKDLFQSIAKMNDQQRSAFILNDCIEMLNGKKVKWATKTLNKTDGYSDAFLEFWTAYPKKIGKGAAADVWKRMKDEDILLPACLKAIEWQKKCRAWREGFIPNPETYLRQRRFEDEPEEDLSKKSVVPKTGYMDMNGVYHEQ